MTRTALMDALKAKLTPEELLALRAQFLPSGGGPALVHMAFLQALDAAADAIRYGTAGAK